MEKVLRWRAEEVDWLAALNHVSHSFLKDMEEQ
jgi:hypothetical protein